MYFIFFLKTDLFVQQTEQEIKKRAAQAYSREKINNNPAGNLIV